MNTIQQIVGAPGVGKTNLMKEAITKIPGRYILAAPRKELLDDALLDLRRLGYTGVIQAIYQDHSNGVSVDQCLTDFVSLNDSSPHAVALITHAALQGSSLDQFIGWHLMLDEAPANAVMTGTLHARASLSSVRELFDLEADPQGRDGIMLLKGRPGNIHDLLGDPQMQGLANLWRRARLCDVFIKCAPRVRADPDLNVDASFIGPHAIMDRWADIAAKHCAYASVWSLDVLSPFESVTIAAAGLEHSLAHLCSPQLYNTTLLPPHPHTGVIRLHGFDNQTQASSTFFVSEPGKANLDKIATYLRDIEPDYWTCNGDKVEDYLLQRMPAGFVKPCQEGSNRLRNARSCAAIYSAKVTPADRLITEIYGITAEQILRAREYEHLSQFVLRGAPRCEGFSGYYDIFVYDMWQVERLADYLLGIGFTVEANHIKLDDMRAKAPPSVRGRKAILTPEEVKARKKQRDRAAYLRKIAA